MRLSCVKIECTDCNTEDYFSAGAFTRLTGKALTDNSAALIPQTLGCQNCSSNNISVLFPRVDKKIVKSTTVVRCKHCKNNITELLFISFPNADFCPLCVSDGAVSDQEVITATGEFFAGEAYWKMSLQFRDDLNTRLYWLRKAVDEGYIYASYTIGDLLARSSNEDEVAEAANAYKLVADSKDKEANTKGAGFRFALMMFKGLGMKANTKEALKIMLRLAEDGHYFSLSELGNIFLTGKYGVEEDHNKAFEFYSKAYDEASFRSMSSSAIVALMLLSGTGTKEDKNRGSDILKEAIEIYADSKPNFDQELCFDEILEMHSSSHDDIKELPNAQIYLTWMVRINVPLAKNLLDRCGGPIPDTKPRWEFSLRSALPHGVRGWSIKDVSIPSSKERVSQPKILGQIEKLSNGEWTVTTDEGVIIGDTFESERKAVEALAEVKECDAQYIDLQTMMRRLTNKA